MKKKILVLLLIAFNFSSAQTPNWTWAKNISLYFNSKQDITAVDNSGNIYVIGDFVVPTATIEGTTFMNTSQATFSDAYILKFNSTGTLLWSKQLGGIKHQGLTSIDTDNSGNVYITGFSGDSITLGTSTLTTDINGYLYFAAKLNSNGDYIWAQRNTGTNESYLFRDIKVDNNGNSFILGIVRSSTLTFNNVSINLPSNDPTVSNSRVFIVKLDTNGNAIWGKSGINSEANTFGTNPTSIAPDNNGGVAICGYFATNTLSFDSIVLTKTTQNSNSSNMFVAKFDSSGNAMWAYNAGTIYDNNTLAKAVTVDAVGNVYVGGSYPNSITFGNINLNASTGSQLFLVKYSPTGTLLWAKTTGFSTNSYTTIRSLDTDENNNIYVAGLTYASTIDFTNFVSLTNLGTTGAFFITKYNTSGNPTWAKAVTNYDANNDITIDCKAENDLFIGGWFNNSTLQLGPVQLTKSAANVDLFVGRLNIAPLSTVDFTNDSFSVYPNPARDVVTISNLKTNSSYTLYNINGQLIKQGNLIKENDTLDITELQSGVYILKTTDLEGSINQRKIIVE